MHGKRLMIRVRGQRGVERPQRTPLRKWKWSTVEVGLATVFVFVGGGGGSGGYRPAKITTRNAIPARPPPFPEPSGPKATTKLGAGRGRHASLGVKKSCSADA